MGGFQTTFLFQTLGPVVHPSYRFTVSRGMYPYGSRLSISEEMTFLGTPHTPLNLTSVFIAPRLRRTKGNGCRRRRKVS